jgi:hypothetical protein
MFKADKFSFFMDLYTISRIYNEHNSKNCCNIFSISNFDKDDFLTEILDCDIFIRSLKIRLLYGDVFNDIRNNCIEQIKLEHSEIDRPMSSLTEIDRPDSTQPGTPILERCSSSLAHDLDQLGVCDCMICIIYYDIDRQWEVVDPEIKNLIS